MLIENCRIYTTIVPDENKNALQTKNVQFPSRPCYLRQLWSWYIVINHICNVDEDVNV